MLNTYHNFIPQIAFQTVLAKMFVTNFKPNSNKLTNNPSCVEFYAHSTYTPHSTQTSNSITRATGIIHTHFYSVMQFQVNQQIAQIRRSRPPRSNWFAIYQKHVILIHSVHHIHLADKSIYRIHKNANYKKITYSHIRKFTQDLITCPMFIELYNADNGRLFFRFGCLDGSPNWFPMA